MNTLTNERLNELSTMRGEDGGILEEAIKETAEMEREILSLRAQLAELRGQNVTNAIRAFVTDEDIKALNRFAECCDDPESGGHDLEQEQVMRLEKIGALQRHGRISYITDFGDLVISLNARPVPPAASQPYTVPDAVTPEDVRWMLSQSDHDDGAKCRIEHSEEIGAKMWNACRAAMLQPNHSGDVADKVNSPVIPDGWVKGKFAYDTLFNAIGKAVNIQGEALSISVKAFEDSMLAAAPQHKGE